MRIFKVFFACLFLTITTSAQNLVPNPSFELMQSLPVSNAQNFDSEVNDWFSGNVLKVLSNHIQAIGYSGGFPNPSKLQMPRTGSAIATFTNMRLAGYGTKYTNERSYPVVKLYKTIVPGDKVYGEIWVSQMEGKSSLFPSGNLGMFFSQDSIYKNNRQYINVTPQINQPNIVTDTINWVKISGSFIAKKKSNYLAIGNFFDDQNTDYAFLVDSSKYSNLNPYSIYFLDDVKVRLLNPEVIDTALVCLGDETTLVATGEENHQWAFAHSPEQIIATDSIFTFKPDSSQTVYFYGSFDTLTTYVIVNDLKIELGSDTLICAENDFWLTHKAQNVTYTKWNGQTIADSLKITETGTYWVEVKKGACIKYDTIFIEVADLTSVKIIEPSLTCLGDELTLYVPFQNHINYLWNTGSTDSSILVKEDGIYSVTITHPCGTAQDNIEVIFNKCVCHFYLPNAFSPNGDGINDEFYPVFECSIRNYFITINDRWGNVVFKSNNPDERWGGLNAETGVYTVYIYYQGLNEEGQTVGDNFSQVLHVLK